MTATHVRLTGLGDQPERYQAVVEAAVDAGREIMVALVQATRRALHERQSGARTLRESQGLVEAGQYLDKYESTLIERYPKGLRARVQAAGDGLENAPHLDAVHFDQLELMDEAQLNERVALARAQQVVLQSVEHSLANFNLLMSSIKGWRSIRADQNPVRSEIYVQTLLATVSQMRLPIAVQQEWMSHMSPALGSELNALYARLAKQLSAQGVPLAGLGTKPFSFSTAGQTPTDYFGPPVPSARWEVPAPSVAPGKAAASVPPDHTTLTLNRLRKLLAGELEQTQAMDDVEPFARKFEREFESGAMDLDPVPADFDITVPAALEALAEMKQVDQVIERINSRQTRATPLQGGVDAARLDRRLGQAISREVVALMVDNLVKDEHLLAPIQAVIRELEPALLQLSLIDPRFFSHKQHPARRWLQEITHRSMGFASVSAPGFTEFLSPLQQAVARLVAQDIEDAQAFEHGLAQLVQVWDEQAQPERQKNAVEALQHAEKRNFLADKMARGIRAKPDAKKVPPGVLDFLCGPWAQVLAHASMEDTSRSADPGKYRELVLALLWSAQPELTGKHIGKLTRLIPKLLAKLREGLRLIDYPPVKTSAFFELLMNLHQQAFQPAKKTKVPVPVNAPRANAPERHDPWVAPFEAQVSGFIELSPEGPEPPSSRSCAMASARDQSERIPEELLLAVGCWVEMLIDQVWMRSQLTWASPTRALFLFTSTHGRTQSMTKRSLDKMLDEGVMRVVSGQLVVEGALDAVVQTALHNSVDAKS